MRHLLIACLAVLPLMSGCVFGNEQIQDEVDTIAWDLRPMELEAQAELSFGRGILGLASTVAGWSNDPDAELASDMLDDIDTVDVGIYELFRDYRDGPDGLTSDGIEELRELGWHPVVRATERRDSSQWVYYREHDGRDQMLVVGIDDEELIVLRLTGDLGGILDSAVRREDDLIVMAHGVHDDF